MAPPLPMSPDWSPVGSYGGYQSVHDPNALISCCRHAIERPFRGKVATASPSEAKSARRHSEKGAPANGRSFFWFPSSRLEKRKRENEGGGSFRLGDGQQQRMVETRPGDAAGNRIFPLKTGLCKAVAAAEMDQDAEVAI